MKKIISLSFTIFSFYISNAQQVWEKSNFPNWSGMTGAVKGIDSGYLISGNLVTSGSQQGDFYLAKIDELGDTVWTRSYDGPADEGSSIFKIYDSSYICFGQLGSFNYCDANDFFIMKLKLNGDTLWTKHYGTCQSDIPQSVVIGPKQGYYYYGTVQYNGSLNLGTTLIRLNQYGDTVWTRFINMGGPSSLPLDIQKQENYACAYALDGGIIITGMVFDSTDHPRSSFLVKIDSNGTIQWKKFFDKPNYNSIGKIYSTPTGYLITGMCSMNNFANYNSLYTAEYGTMIIKTDLNGNPVWGKMYRDMVNGGYSKTTLQSSLLKDDGSIVVSSYRQYSSFDFVNANFHHNLVCFKTDGSGNLSWFKKYNIAADDVMPFNLCQTRDNGFLLVATSDFYDTANSMHPAIYNGLLVKVDSLGNGCNDSTLTMGVIDFTSQIVTSDTVMPQVGFYPVTVSHSPFTYGRGINYSTICSGNVGINEIKPDDEQLVIYPNPNDGEFFINLNKEYKNIEINITDVLGKLVYGETLKETSQTLLQLNIPSGVYFLSIVADGKRMNKKLVKQ